MNWLYFPITQHLYLKKGHRNKAGIDPCYLSRLMSVHPACFTLYILWCTARDGCTLKDCAEITIQIVFFFFLTLIHWIWKTGTVIRFTCFVLFFLFAFPFVASVTTYMWKKNIFKTSLKYAMSRKMLFQYHQTIFSYPYALIIAVSLVSNFSFHIKLTVQHSDCIL